MHEFTPSSMTYLLADFKPEMNSPAKKTPPGKRKEFYMKYAFSLAHDAWRDPQRPVVR